MSNTLVEAARTNLAELERNYAAELTGLEQRIAGLPDTASMEDVEAARTASQTRIDAFESQITEARKRVESTEAITRAREGSAHLIPAGDLRVTEPRTYASNNPETSFLSDLFNFRMNGSQEALKRLQRNNAEVVESRTGNGRESRATITTSDFYAPQFLGDLFVTSRRQRLVYASLVTTLTLPAGGETVYLPRYTAPTDAANAQGGDNQAITSNAGSTDQLSGPIYTVSGYVDTSRQSIERAMPGLDQILGHDLAADVNKKIDNYTLNGNGTNQAKGVFQEGAVPSVTASGQTINQYLLKLADLCQRIETACGQPPTFLLMHPRRWAWLTSLVDATTNRPVIVPSSQGPYNSFGTMNALDTEYDPTTPDVVPIGQIMGLSVYTDSNIGTASGAGTNEDYSLVGVPSLAVRWKDPADIREFRFDGVVSATGSVRIQAWSYSAYLTRYPTAFGILKGMTAPAF